MNPAPLIASGLGAVVILAGVGLWGADWFAPIVLYFGIALLVTGISLRLRRRDDDQTAKAAGVLARAQLWQVFALFGTVAVVIVLGTVLVDYGPTVPPGRELLAACLVYGAGSIAAVPAWIVFKKFFRAVLPEVTSPAVIASVSLDIIAVPIVLMFDRRLAGVLGLLTAVLIFVGAVLQKRRAALEAMGQRPSA